MRGALLESFETRARGVETPKDSDHGDGNTSTEDAGVRNQGVDWKHRGNRRTSEEDALLRKLIANKTPPLVISVKMTRSLQAIRMRLIALRRRAKGEAA